MSPIKALSLWQPWASLIALGVKTIETRSWSTSYRGPLAIHAAKRRPDTETLEDGPAGELWDSEDHPERCLAQWAETDKRDYAPGCVPPPELRWTLYTDLLRTNGFCELYPMPLGAVVATCELVDVVPIVSPDYIDRRPRGGCPTKVVTVRLDRDDRDEHGEPFARAWTYGEITPSQGCWSSGEGEPVAYGDFTPGRFAWLLDNVKPLDPPVPAKGRQGLWTWTP